VSYEPADGAGLEPAYDSRRDLVRTKNALMPAELRRHSCAAGRAGIEPANP